MSDTPASDRRPSRRSVRLKGYDYAQAGGYFITICTLDGTPLFGRVVEGEMLLNELGRAVEDEWLRTSALRPSVILDGHVVMPNHVHGILILTDDHRDPRLRAGVTQGVPDTPLDTPAPPPETQSLRSPSQTVGAIVRGFKAATTRRMNVMRGSRGGGLWHRNYYEHVIRNDADMNRIRDYIADNPRRWREDRFFRE